jgi:hypothetical protein
MAMFVDRHAVTSGKQAHAPSRDVGGVAWQNCRLFCDMSLLYTKLSGQMGSRRMVVPRKQTSKSSRVASIHG